MRPRSAISEPSIDAVLAEFVESRRPTLDESEIRLYRHVILLLELCLNNYGHRNLDARERAFYEARYHDGKKLFFELFGPDKILAELDFFASTFLAKDVHTSERVYRLAPEVVADLRQWLVREQYVAAAEDEKAILRQREHDTAKRGSRRICRLLRRTRVSVEAESMMAEDYIPSDHHLVQRVAPSRIWFSVYRSAKSETVGPIWVPSLVSDALRVGWNVHCALGRLRGRWRFVEVEGIHPRG
ncbi:MAG TPA: hypothetical protein VEK15_24595 [Vicinamibacteria bacterium]|nr:hypothetical protein [Vicinamibacteria bacterium]